MSTADQAAIADSELGSLFSGLDHFPALILGISGGPDSTALMVLAARWRSARAFGPELIAVTVDHGLRPEAQAEAAAVARLAHTLGLAHRTLHWTGPKPKTGLQQAARTARYGLLAEAAHEAGAGAVLTGHTRDDQAETVLIRLLRGSGLMGLAGMTRVSPLPTAQRAPAPLAGEGWGGGYAELPSLQKSPPSRPPSPLAQAVDLPRKGGGDAEIAARSQSQQLVLIRPFLDLPKVRLIATLEAAEIPYAQDPSNRDPLFTRSRLRALMPELAKEGLDTARLALLARRAQRAQAAIEAAVDRAEAELTIKTSIPGALVLNAEGFAGLPGEIGLRLLGRAIDRLGDEGPVELAKLEALREALERAQASNARFRRSLAGAIVTLKGARIVVERAPPRSGKGQPRSGRGQSRAVADP